MGYAGQGSLWRTTDNQQPDTGYTLSLCPVKLGARRSLWTIQTRGPYSSQLLDNKEVILWLRVLGFTELLHARIFQATGIAYSTWRVLKTRTDPWLWGGSARRAAFWGSGAVNVLMSHYTDSLLPNWPCCGRLGTRSDQPLQEYHLPESLIFFLSLSLSPVESVPWMITPLIQASLPVFWSGSRLCRV